MSIFEKQLGLTELPQNVERADILADSPDFSFTAEDSSAIYDGLFSGKESKRAQKIFLRLLVGMYEDEAEKEELLDELEELTSQAAGTHLEKREE
jgi:hypothetical protein